MLQQDEDEVVLELCHWIQDRFGEGPWVAAGVVASSLLLGFGVHFILRGVIALLSRTRTGFNGEVVRALRNPVVTSVVLGGLFVAVNMLGIDQEIAGLIGRVLLTLALAVWTMLGMRVGGILLSHASGLADRFSVVDKRTLPLFANLVTVVVLALATYLFLLTWEINATGWLASAGIVGVAVGFAAKDTLSNLFAGVFIVADAPYQLGDYVVLDGGLRGEVIHIGLRSTRVRTRDDVQVTIPNAVIGASRIVNQSGGGTTAMRVPIPVGVAYGSQVEQVKRVLEEIAQSEEDALEDPAPRVRFRALGDYSLEFELLLWVPEPSLRGVVVDSVLTRIIQRFAEEGIQIPFPRQDLHLLSDR